MNSTQMTQMKQMTADFRCLTAFGMTSAPSAVISGEAGNLKKSAQIRVIRVKKSKIVNVLIINNLFF